MIELLTKEKMNELSLMQDVHIIIANEEAKVFSQKILSFIQNNQFLNKLFFVEDDSMEYLNYFLNSFYFHLKINNGESLFSLFPALQKNEEIEKSLLENYEDNFDFNQKEVIFKNNIILLKDQNIHENINYLLELQVEYEEPYEDWILEENFKLMVNGKDLKENQQHFIALFEEMKQYLPN